MKNNKGKTQKGKRKRIAVTASVAIAILLLLFSFGPLQAVAQQPDVAFAESGAAAAQSGVETEMPASGTEESSTTEELPEEESPLPESDAEEPEEQADPEERPGSEEPPAPEELPNAEEQPGSPDSEELPAPEPDDASSTPDDAPEEEPDASPAQGTPKAHTAGQITIGGIIYWCYANGEAGIRNASKATGSFVVPSTIEGLGGETYLVTRIEGYNVGELYKGAFQGSTITGISFAEGSQLQYIGSQAFSAAYGLAGSTIDIPATVTYIGSEAFYLFSNDIGISAIRYRHVAQVTGSLPSLGDESPLEVPEDAKQYESVVDSSNGNDTLHKAASWTDTGLTEAEIRIDYGRRQPPKGEIDFVFVVDHSNSMLSYAKATDENGVENTYPRSFLTDDIVYGISKIILDSGAQGYDNRVALAAFGTSSDNKPLWNMDFTASAAAVEDTLFNHPATLQNQTNYNAGLQGAIDLINGRADKSRMPVVIFLSDGAPNQDNYGTAQAKTLRNMGVGVYPISVFIKPTSYLKAISHDGNTAYDGSSTDAFESIIMKVVEDIVQQEVPLEISLQDVLSDHFIPATGAQSDITVSAGGGSASLAGDTLTWNLTGSASDIVHHLLVKVKLKPGSELTASGTLPTNASLGAVDGSIATTAQPQLQRYLAHYQFENGSAPGQPLPDEVMALLPQSGGGYRNGAAVEAGQVQEEVELPNGDKWMFTGWEQATTTIDGADVTFTGVWSRAGLNFSFTKTDAAGAGLAGAGFQLYVWQGQQAPAGQDAYVAPENTAADKWVKAGAAFASAEGGGVQIFFPGGGTYQLVETTAPAGYHLPQVQWRFAVGEGYTLESVTTIPRDGAVQHLVDFEKTTEDGADIWSLPNYPETAFSFLKISSVHYHDGETSAVALDGAEFALYFWAGAAAPGAEELVTEDGVAQGLWQLAGTAASQNGGNVSFTIPGKAGWVYQLVETKAPENFQLPGGQWRLGFTPQGNVDTAAIERIAAPGGGKPPPLHQMPDGQFAGQLALVNIPVYELPAMGGSGTGPFIWAGTALLLGAAITGVLVRTHKARKAKRKMSRLAWQQSYKAQMENNRHPLKK